MKHQIVLLLGSNLGNRSNNLKEAIAEISQHVGRIQMISSLYETEPWGTNGQPDFLNQAVVVESDLSPGDALHAVLEIEANQGRRRQEKWGARVIDIDILFYDALKINTKHLTVPHPFMHQRKFVLVPLMEVLPNWMHPVFEKTISQLYANLDDVSQVRRVKPESVQSRSAP